ncbi:MAG TPA: hypothetical protein VLU92_11930 [Candidatus Dormibacteraeota bacterium]|nr:hypothetical protein [Candidatus Dormibacteraeota bacterium]
MNDFDRFLQIKLRQMLDPVVATPPPTRNGRRKRNRPALRVLTSPIELFAGAFPALEPVRVTISVASGHSVP